MRNTIQPLFLKWGTVITLLLAAWFGKASARQEGPLIVYRGSIRDFDQICTADPDTHSSFCLTDESYPNEFNPQWSPDRKTIVFNSDRTGFYEIYVMNVDGSDQKQLTKLQSPYLTPGFSWESNGKQILFTSLDNNAWSIYYLVDPEGDLCVLLAQSDSGVEVTPSCISSGDRILVDLYDGKALNVFFINSGSSDLFQLTTADEGGYGGAQISPDGEYIALLGVDSFSDESSNNPKLYLMRSDGTNLRYVADLPIAVSMLGWSPDSTKVAFTAYNAGDQGTSINVIGIHDTEPQQITDGTTTDSFGDWSPDGQRIVFSRLSDAGWQLSIMNSDGTNQQLVAECGRKECGPDW